MTNEKPPQIFGINADDWKAAYSEAVQEFPATRFLVSEEGAFVRFAFGRNGALIDENGGRSSPVYGVAVSLPPHVALELRDVLNRILQTVPAQVEREA